MASGMVVLGASFVTCCSPISDWWDEVFGWFGGLKINLNLGAYFWFSTLMLVLWAVCVFVIDRLSYWEIKPGQLTRHSPVRCRFAKLQRARHGPGKAPRRSVPALADSAWVRETWRFIRRARRANRSTSATSCLSVRRS
jgi:hypothetical protein